MVGAFRCERREETGQNIVCGHVMGFGCNEGGIIGVQNSMRMLLPRLPRRAKDRSQRSALFYFENMDAATLKQTFSSSHVICACDLLLLFPSFYLTVAGPSHQGLEEWAQGRR